VKQVSLLVKVSGQAKAPPSVAWGSAGRYKDEINRELLKELKQEELFKLYGGLASKEPKLDLASYHISVPNKPFLCIVRITSRVG
jgi:hypothetical protein